MMFIDFLVEYFSYFFSGMVIRKSNEMCSLDNLSTTTRIAVSLSFVFGKLNIKSIDISSHFLFGGGKGLKFPIVSGY